MLSTQIQVRNYNDWRTSARTLLHDRIPPDEVVWISDGDTQEQLFDPAPPPAAAPPDPSIRIPKEFLRLAETVARHSDPARWVLLYRVAWRLTNGERSLLEIDTDDDVMKLNAMRRSVEKDIYRMRAFVRFRKVESEDGEQFVAWYRPEHHTLDANGDFFAKRFGGMRWAILTPESSLVWDLHKLQTGPGVPRSAAPQDDELEDLWRLYYRTVYNPARLNTTAMRAQLPINRWIDLPESRVIPDLVRTSQARVQQMADEQPASASDFVPSGAALPELREAVENCRACNLCRLASGPVFGEGNPQAKIMFVGEQPGDEEDLRKRPFVGPAGKVLDQAFEAAGILRPDVYVTNAVKAFRFEERGKRRIHQTPRNSDISVCRPWLLAEMKAVQPDVIVCLGATAAQSILGRKVTIGNERGRFIDTPAARVAVTYHPSAVLRSPDEAAQQELFSKLAADLAAASTDQRNCSEKS